MELPKYLPGTDIEGFPVTITGLPLRKAASQRAMAFGWWQITDTRTAVGALAAESGYGQIRCASVYSAYSELTARQYGVQVALGKNKWDRNESVIPTIQVAPDSTHVRRYVYPGVRDYMEAEIAKINSLYERDAKRHREYCHHNLKLTRPCYQCAAEAREERNNRTPIHYPARYVPNQTQVAS